MVKSVAQTANFVVCRFVADGLSRDKPRTTKAVVALRARVLREPAAGSRFHEVLAHPLSKGFFGELSGSKSFHRADAVGIRRFEPPTV